MVVGKGGGVNINPMFGSDAIKYSGEEKSGRRIRGGGKKGDVRC